MDGSQLVRHARTTDHIGTTQTGRLRWSLQRLLIAALVLAVLAAATPALNPGRLYQMTSDRSIFLNVVIYWVLISTSSKE
jgi:hypothetical protein